MYGPGTIFHSLELKTNTKTEKGPNAEKTSPEKETRDLIDFVRLHHFLFPITPPQAPRIYQTLNGFVREKLALTAKHACTDMQGMLTDICFFSRKVITVLAYAITGSTMSSFHIRKMNSQPCECVAALEVGNGIANTNNGKGLLSTDHTYLHVALLRIKA